MNYNIQTYVTIDPGYSGKIIIYSDRMIVQVKMPRTFLEIISIFRKIKNKYPNTLVGIEAVQMMPSDINSPGKAFNIQKMVINYKEFINSLDAVKLPYLKISPRKWQGYLNLTVKGEDKKQRKSRFKNYAYFRFPNLQVTNANQDALCILMFLFKIAKEDPVYIAENGVNIDLLELK